MDNSRSETPAAFVSKRGLQAAVDGLTDNFRSWLDAIHQSILASLQNKADSAQVEDIAKQVRDAAGRASDSVASFAKRAIGGHCASCDAPLSNEKMHWRKPAPSGSQARGGCAQTEGQSPSGSEVGPLDLKVNCFQSRVAPEPVHCQMGCVRFG